MSAYFQASLVGNKANDLSIGIQLSQQWASRGVLVSYCIVFLFR